MLYIDELLGNQAAPPPHPFWKFAFWVSGSAPGLRINRIFKTVLCTEPARIARTLLEALEGEPILVPAHGAPLRRAEDVVRARALLQSIAA